MFILSDEDKNLIHSIYFSIEYKYQTSSIFILPEQCLTCEASNNIKACPWFGFTILTSSTVSG